MTESHYSFPVIGFVRSCFKEKFGIPRQPGLAPLAKAKLELISPYDDPAAWKGLEGVSHLWIQFVFHANDSQAWKPKVRPPRLGGNQSIGVFATRSPFRPAPIGLSVVRLEALDLSSGKAILLLSGVDLLDGTPVLDVKPYVPYVDSVAEALNPIAATAPKPIEVEIPEQLQTLCLAYQLEKGIDLAELIRQVLQQDPKPAYQEPSPDRIYGMQLYDLELRWTYLPSGNIQVKAIDAQSR